MGSSPRTKVTPRDLFVDDREDEQEISHLHAVNEQLSASLDRCRALLSDCRSKLAANSNEEGSPNEGEEDEAGQRAG